VSTRNWNLITATNRKKIIRKITEKLNSPVLPVPLSANGEFPKTKKNEEMSQNPAYFI
jgi:hypothetical protein